PIFRVLLYRPKDKHALVMQRLITISHALLLCIMLPYNGLYAQKKENAAKSETKKSSDLYLRAPNLVPGTLPEMRQASYWIAKMKNPDQVVLSLEEIKSRNEDYRERMANASGIDSMLSQKIHKQLMGRPGLLAHIPDLSSKTPNELSALVQDWIKTGTDYLRSREFGNIMAIAYSEEQLLEIENEMSFDSSKGQIEPLSGITTTACRLRIVPLVKPEYMGHFTNGKARWDLWNLDVLPIGTAVQILYTSSTGAFLFVLSERGYGWVASNEIATGSTKEIDDFSGVEDFIVCTGDWVPLYTDSDCTMVSGWMLMGDRLPMVGTNPQLVSIPFRNANGTFSVQEAWLKPDADVHVGYLPYTQKNVAKQAFKLLDNLYDWTGAWYGRNHATNLRDVFRNFGFELPANGILLSAYGNEPQKVFSNEGREAQFKSILSNEPFLTLQICENSHSQLFMGDNMGMPIVFDAHGYSYKDGEGNDLEIKRWVVGTIEMPDYFLKQDITFVKLY
ncbi:MAG: SH3 domain-containing protein, partial [Eudoraea sp.]|nr:SH3 domain-containing protein [Eudoraea sp.]